MNYSMKVKNELTELIRSMQGYQWLFVANPNIDFVRKRKLSFETMLQLLISMESGTLKNELLKSFNYSVDTATVSAFNQQRRKILPEAFQFLFHEFNSSFPEERTYRGYRLLACDGSDLNISRNPHDEENYFQSTPDSKGFNQLHLNAIYDLCNRRYTDAVIQPGRSNNECLAMCDMIDRYHGAKNAIFIADRGYESYNIFAHATEKKQYYLIRARDSDKSCIISSLKQLPCSEQYDVSIPLILTRKQTNVVKTNPTTYKFLAKTSPFDYLDLHINKFYPITLRLLRFPITEDTYECIITNLPRDEFPLEEIKKLYAMRWGIETSFRELKYAIGISCFHSKKVEYIKQEIWARLILYNFCEIITTKVVVTQKETKYTYQLNYTMAIHICRYFLNCKPDISPPDVEALIAKNLLPIRTGRQDPRKVRPQSVVSFLYRAA